MKIFDRIGVSKLSRNFHFEVN